MPNRVIVNSLPKSGTHLVESLLELLGYSELEGGFGGSLIRRSHRNIFKNFKKYLRTTNDFNKGIPIDLDDSDTLIDVRWLTKNRLSKLTTEGFYSGHIPYSQILENVLEQSDVRMIFITRDPRDVVVSYVNYHLKNIHLPYHKLFHQLGFFEAVKTVLADDWQQGIARKSLRSRIQSVKGWTDSNVAHWTTFEKLVGPNGGGTTEDQFDEITQIANVLQIDISGRSLVNLSRSLFNSSSQTFHKGQIGGWKTHLTMAQSAELSDLLQVELSQLGYSQ